MRARVYFFMLPVVAWAALFSWSQLELEKQESFYERYSLPLMALWLMLCWAGLLPRWMPFRWVEQGIFWGSATLMVLNVYYNLLAIAREGLWGSSVWLAIIFVMAYFVFEPRLAWRVSLGLFLAFLLAGFLALAPQVAQGVKLDGNGLVQLYVSQLSYLVLFRVLVFSKEHGLRAQLEAAHLHHLAHTDPLTGVANRRSILKSLEEALLRHQQTAEPLCLVLLDLDRFKQINDCYGHEVGDRVLVQATRVLQQNLRPGDQLGRWGGEEFMLLLPNTSLAEAEELCARLQPLLAQHDHLPPVSASFGVAAALPGDNPRSLIARADSAMYASKQAGGNQVKVAS